MSASIVLDTEELTQIISHCVFCLDDLAGVDGILSKIESLNVNYQYCGRAEVAELPFISIFSLCLLILHFLSLAHLKNCSYRNDFNAADENQETNEKQSALHRLLIE